MSINILTILFSISSFLSVMTLQVNAAEKLGLRHHLRHKERKRCLRLFNQHKDLSGSKRIKLTEQEAEILSSLENLESLNTQKEREESQILGQFRKAVNDKKIIISALSEAIAVISSQVILFPGDRKRLEELQSDLSVYQSGLKEMQDLALARAEGTRLQINYRANRSSELTQDIRELKKNLAELESSPSEPVIQHLDKEFREAFQGHHALKNQMEERLYSIRGSLEKLELWHAVDVEYQPGDEIIDFQAMAPEVTKAIENLIPDDKSVSVNILTLKRHFQKKPRTSHIHFYLNRLYLFSLKFKPKSFSVKFYSDQKPGPVESQ